MLYLRKANDDVISFCQCGDGRVGSPGQLDCPWCGCGWLFTCITCRKAFTFAEAVDIDVSWEELAKLDALGRRGELPSQSEIEGWSEAMQLFTKDLEAGKLYVYLDGHYIEAAAKHVQIDGWDSYHCFDEMPQVLAKADMSLLNSTLGSRDY